MRISVRVQPGSKKDEIEEQEDGSYLVKVKAVADKGKANVAVIRLLSRRFKTDVRIVSGFTSRHKIVETS